MITVERAQEIVNTSRRLDRIERLIDTAINQGTRIDYINEFIQDEEIAKAVYELIRLEVLKYLQDEEKRARKQLLLLQSNHES
jgi:hypothetical protein